MTARALLLATVLGGSVASSGCAERIAESRIRGALISNGVPADTADCMARRMVDRLTIAQLRRLEALRGADRSLGAFLAAVRRINDSEVVAVTASSAAL